MQASIVRGATLTWTATQEASAAGYDAARKRVEERVKVAKGGKALLEQGGSGTKVAISAKLAAGSAKDMDADVTQRATSAVAAFDDAAQRIREAVSRSQEVHPGVGGVDSFVELADAYEARVRLYRNFLNELSALPPVPELSPEERDAAAVMQLTDHCQFALQRTAEGCAALKKKAQETVVANTNESKSIRDRVACL